MNNSSNRWLATLVTALVVLVCMAAIPLVARLGLLFLYIEPNPRHLPPVLTGEAVGWAIIGMLTGAFVVIITETLVWSGTQGFWDKYRGLVIASIIAIIAGTTLGIFFAIIQMDSVDGQAMTSQSLAVLAGGTAAFLSTIAGIVAGTTLRRYVVSMYRLPDTSPRGRLTFNDEDATGAAQPAGGRRGNAS